MQPIIPVPSSRIHKGFTSSSSLARSSGNANMKYVPLDDSALGVHKVFNRTSHNVVSPPAPSRPNPDDGEHPEKAWEAVYPHGSINPSASVVGGFSFYVAGPAGFLDGAVKEAIMGYRVMFQPGWEWAKGGKLPGIFGGVGDASYHCSGGRQNDRCQCFDARLMWRPNGAGEIYTYFPLTEGNETALLRVPGSRKNPDYGFSVGLGAFTWPVGRWVDVAFRVKLNEINALDGELELYVDGKTVISVHGLNMKMSSDSRIKGMHFQTFFGGHTDEWASPKNQQAWFGDVTGMILA
ncbi:uncharacterized protein BT62DRAFT_198879 [Guyanagaster necrorhizus]|uniref:Polysaccharide lyase 14 domain-containing protein n=1 Tax=Guyanagaster necrorhizus TaxID=856835 RepID=A0A9P8AR11_9AGAR|nr:uncharacterized protein BT62DRAFT_198879 [Guyanagaster necrorhizus MCA 3950]KAG7444918.1 hypothetical protein BT62DRAFT_198879 [Guyanagaster necrorhizus MCA 3950]